MSSPMLVLSSLLSEMTKRKGRSFLCQCFPRPVSCSDALLVCKSPLAGTNVIPFDQTNPFPNHKLTSSYTGSAIV